MNKRLRGGNLLPLFTLYPYLRGDCIWMSLYHTLKKGRKIKERPRRAILIVSDCTPQEIGAFSIKFQRLCLYSYKTNERKKKEKKKIERNSSYLYIYMYILYESTRYNIEN